MLETTTKETFLDRRNSQISALNFDSLAKCVHTKNIFSLLDMSHSDANFARIKKHVETCRVCETELKKFELENIEVKIHIPKPQIDSETKEIFSREVSELFKIFDLNEKTLLKKIIKSKIQNIDTFGISLVKNFTSKKMIATYAFGAVLFVVLRHFFV